MRREERREDDFCLASGARDEEATMTPLHSLFPYSHSSRDCVVKGNKRRGEWILPPESRRRKGEKGKGKGGREHAACADRSRWSSSGSSAGTEAASSSSYVCWLLIDSTPLSFSRVKFLCCTCDISPPRVSLAKGEAIASSHRAPSDDPLLPFASARAPCMCVNRSSPAAVTRFFPVPVRSAVNHQLES